MTHPSQRSPGVTVVVEQAGEQVNGLWCTPCALPSGSAIALLVWIDGDLSAVQVVQVCQDCGAEVVA